MLEADLGTVSSWSPVLIGPGWKAGPSLRIAGSRKCSQKKSAMLEYGPSITLSLWRILSLCKTSGSRENAFLNY